MLKWFGSAAVIATVALLVFTLASSRATGQAGRITVPRMPRTADGHPNLNGLWQAINSAYWDLEDHAARQGPIFALGGAYNIAEGVGVVEGGTIPYRPEALAKKKENYEKSLKLLLAAAKEGAGPHIAEKDYHALDPEIPCYLPGVPRATYMPYPFQIVQSPETVLIAYEYDNASRIIRMNSTEEAPAESWMGWSRGRWEKETLVVDVTSLLEETWFDRAGNFHSDALHVVERYTPIDRDHLNYEATIEDPKVFTRPWNIRMPLYRRIEKGAQLGEYLCVDYASELLYGQYTKKPTSQ
jgi:hypothetical protein